MADIAFLPLPIAVAPAPAAPAATTAVEPADPFASLLAALGDCAPAAAVAVASAATLTAAPPLLADPSDASGDGDPPVGADATADDDHKDAPAPSPLGEITAMLALVLPPPVADPAPAAREESVDSSSRSGQPARGTPGADAVRLAETRPDAPPLTTDVQRDAANAVVRALQGGAAPGAIIADSAAPIVAAATGDSPAPRRTASATRAAATAAPETPAAPAEPATPDQPRAPRRTTLATAAAPDPLAASAPRADFRAAADPIAAALPDDPVARQLSVTRDGQWLDTLARDIAAAGGQDGQLRFRLDPDHLGALTVAIAQGADGASVRLTASTEQARAILTDAQPRLVAEARAQGLHLREATVETNAAASAGASGGQSGGGARGGDANGLAAQLQQQQQGRRQPAPEPARAPRRAETRAAAAAHAAADLYA